MLRYTVQNVVKYRDFFIRQIRASILPTKYCKFYILLYFFYSKLVKFLQKPVFYITTVKQTKYIFL